MADVRDVVTDALLELGVIAADETATAADALSGLRALNRLVDQWAAERLTIYAYTTSTYLFVSGTQDYTVGSSGNFATARPINVDRLRLNYQDSTTSPVEERPLTAFTEELWAHLTPKSLTANEPSGFYYDASYPLATISLWPVPTSATLTGVLYVEAPVSEFTSLSAAISLPPGYRRMLVKNLALEMAPSYERPAQRELIQAAIESKTVVKRSNRRTRDLTFDPGALLGALGGGYDINTDH